MARNGAPTSPGPSPADRVSPPGALGSGDAAATTAGPATSAGQPPPRVRRRGPKASRATAQPRPGERAASAAGRADRRHGAAVTGAHRRAPSRSRPRGGRRRRRGARSRRAGAARRPPAEEAHRLRLLERGQDERPAAAGGDPDRPVRRRPRARPRTIACSTDETCSTRRRVGVVGGEVGRDPVRHVRRRPDRLARDDDEPRPEGIRVDGDGLEPVADLERARPPARRRASASAPPRRTSRRRRRKTSGRWCSSSNSSSASIRPSTRT